MNRRDRLSSGGSTVSSVISSFSKKSREATKENIPSKLPRGPTTSKEIGNRTKDMRSSTGAKSHEKGNRISSTGSTGSHSEVSSASSRRESARSSLSSADGEPVTVLSQTGFEPVVSVTGFQPQVLQTDSLSAMVTNGSHVSPSSETTASLNVTDTGKVRSPKFVNPDQSGYVGFANLPNQVHRKSVKKGFEFTLMVVGAAGLGKSTLVNSLFLTDLYPERQIPSAKEKIQQTVKIDASTVEIEERGVRLRLTVVDTPGFGDSLNSTDCFKPIIQYVDDQFERYLNDESGLNRRHIVDNRVHCCFYFIDPSGHGLRPLDIAFMKALHHKVNVVPVIAKADTLTYKEVLSLKRKIMQQVEQHGISLYPLPDCDDDEDEDFKEQCKQLKAAVPFAVVGSNTIIEVKGKKVRGRMYPWGVVEVENPEHCDFIKLRTMLITHMQDLQEVTQEVHYENFRAERLATGAPLAARKSSRSQPNRNNGGGDQIEAKEQALQEKERELRLMQEKLARMQAEMEAAQKSAQNGVRSHNV